MYQRIPPDNIKKLQRYDVALGCDLSNHETSTGYQMIALGIRLICTVYLNLSVFGHITRYSSVSIIAPEA